MLLNAFNYFLNLNSLNIKPSKPRSQRFYWFLIEFLFGHVLLVRHGKRDLSTQWLYHFPEFMQVRVGLQRVLACECNHNARFLPQVNNS